MVTPPIATVLWPFMWFYISSDYDFEYGPQLAYETHMKGSPCLLHIIHHNRRVYTNGLFD